MGNVGMADNQEESIHYVYKDHLGSILALTSADGNAEYEQSFGAWGRYRDAEIWQVFNSDPSANALTVDMPVWMSRGYTGHEHLREFDLVNMNACMYDPTIGRMLTPDNFVQAPGFTQSHNRYAYAWNNPLKYTDPDGEIVWVPMVIGAVVGAYMGGVTANEGEFNPGKWTSSNTAGYMIGGAIVGAISGAASYGVSTSGMPMANTASIMAGSFTNSVGMHIVTGGKTDVSISFGVASYNFSQGTWGYLGKQGNSTLENIGYAMGAVANVSDILAGFNPSSVELRTENDPNYSKTVDAEGNPIIRKDKIGHTQITDGKGKRLIDFGPAPGHGVNGFDEWVPGTNRYTRGGLISLKKMKWDPLMIDGVNADRIANWNPSGKYNLAVNSCVSAASRALNASGVLNIGIHPYLLHAQMYLRSIGMRPMMFSYHLQ